MWSGYCGVGGGLKLVSACVLPSIYPWLLPSRGRTSTGSHNCRTHGIYWTSTVSSVCLRTRHSPSRDYFGVEVRSPWDFGSPTIQSTSTSDDDLHSLIPRKRYGWVQVGYLVSRSSRREDSGIFGGLCQSEIVCNPTGRTPFLDGWIPEDSWQDDESERRNEW